MVFKGDKARLLFLGCLFRQNDESRVLRYSNLGVSNAANTFQWNLLYGLSQHVDLDVINVLPVGIYPTQYRQLALKSTQWTWGDRTNNLEIGCINIPIIKQMQRYKSVRSEIRKRVLGDDGIGHIIIYSPYLPFLAAIRSLDRRIRVTLIVTDLPEFYDLGLVGGARKLLRKVNNGLVYRCLARVDSFVLLTDAMKVPLEVGNRPYVVIEGISDYQGAFQDELPCDQENENSGKKVILYAGTLHYRFGIQDLLNAFSFIRGNDYELWLCGSGDAEREIIKAANSDSRIRYYGYLEKSEVKALQNRATVLVNPRTNDGEYTKYSFPSKTIEYLASGKVVLMHKLDGIPDEYDQYLVYFDSNSPEDMASKISCICEMSAEERISRGQRGREYVMRFKNGPAQAGKLLDMISFGYYNDQYPGFLHDV